MRARQLVAEETIPVAEETIPLVELADSISVETDPCSVEIEAPLPPRVMKVAMIIAGAIVRQLRAEAAAQSRENEPEAGTR